MALITGIAIVHTTGMPVVYSFELGISRPYLDIRGMGLQSTRIFATLFLPFFETTLPCADFKRFLKITKNRDDDFIVDLSSSVKQVVYPAHGYPILANWYDEISFIIGIRAPWSH